MFCPYCGKEVTEGQSFCQHCGAGLAQSAAGPAMAALESRTKTGWEDRENSGFLSGLFATLNKALFRPSEFFRKMPVTGGLTDPLLYALIVGMIGMIFMYFWQTLFKGAVDNFMPPGMAAAAGQQAFHGVGLAVMAALSPLIIIGGLFISSGILHVCLLMVKGARAGYEATFRVVAYSYSANILFVVPICGSFIAGIWALVLMLIGLREAHEISGGKAAFAVFLPVIFFCALFFFLISVLFMGVFAASFGSMMHMQR